jgi:hypothetical protein
VQYYQLRFIIWGIWACNLPWVGVLGQRTAVAMVRQLVESRPVFLPTPKRPPMGKRVKKGKIMNKNRPVNKSNAASDQKRIRENAAVLKALNSA